MKPRGPCLFQSFVDKRFAKADSGYHGRIKTEVDALPEPCGVIGGSTGRKHEILCVCVRADIPGLSLIARSFVGLVHAL